MDALRSALTAYLPPHDGYLPKWLFLVLLPPPYPTGVYTR